MNRKYRPCLDLSVLNYLAVFKQLISHVIGKAGLQLLGHLGRIFGQLWHEVIGFTFLALAVIAVPAVVKEWNGDSKSRLVMACAFVLTMVYFGITSFLRARKSARHDS